MRSAPTPPLSKGGKFSTDILTYSIAVTVSPPTTRFRRWITAALVVYWLIIFTGTHVPRIPVQLETGGSDKALHYLAYAGLTFLLAARYVCTAALTARATGMLFIIAAIYGIADELLQGPVGRDPSVYDWFADLIGAMSGLLVFAALWRFRRKVPQND